MPTLHRLARFTLYAAFALSIAPPPAAARQTTSVRALIGEWNLEAIAPSLDAPRVTESRVWEFRDNGTIITSDFRQDYNKPIRHTIEYQVRNGKIMTDFPGRPKKDLSYEVVELTPSRLTLRGGLAGYYFFERVPSSGQN